MPVSPDYAMELAKEALVIFTEAEETMLEKVARRLASGIHQPGWADSKLVEIQALRAEVEGIVRDLQAGSKDAIERALRIGYNRGIATAGLDIEAAGSPDGIAFSTGSSDTRMSEHAFNAMLRATQEQFDMTGLRIRRWTLDTFQDVIQQSTAQTVIGVESRREAAKKAMDRFAQRGVTGFIDKAGRSWDLASYAEMSLRTSTGQAMVQGHVDKLVESGYDLVMVSNAPEECKICRPWEGKVLSLTGRTRGKVTGDNLHGPGKVTATIAGTLREATSDGLFHPNCRHSTTLYQVGVTKPLVRTADPEGDKLRQRQRQLERNVRESKRRLAVLKGFHYGYNGPKPNPFAADLKVARERTAQHRGALADFIADTGRKNLAYRTSLKSR